MDWSVDGHLVFTVFSGMSPSLKVYSTADRQVAPFAIGAEARFSPDGKWIAYVGPLSAPDSDAIFIAPFRGPGVPIRVSSGSGAQPTWAHDGKRLFYVAPDRKLMMVEFDPRAKSAAAPRVLFQSRIIAIRNDPSLMAQQTVRLIDSLQRSATPRLSAFTGQFLAQIIGVLFLVILFLLCMLVPHLTARLDVRVQLGLTAFGFFSIAFAIGRDPVRHCEGKNYKVHVGQGALTDLQRNI
jgi:hypothetical protein